MRDLYGLRADEILPGLDYLDHGLLTRCDKRGEDHAPIGQAGDGITPKRDLAKGQPVPLTGGRRARRTPPASRILVVPGRPHGYSGTRAYW